MINYNLSRFDVSSSRPAPLAQNSGVFESGQALVVVDDGAGTLAVKASTGAAGEKFFGVSMTSNTAPTRLTGAITVVGTGATNDTFISNYINGSAVILDSTNTKVTSTAKITIDSTGKIETTSAATDTDVFTVIYSYTPTLGQIQDLIGDFENVPAINVGAEPGVARHALLYLSNYDTSVVWTIGATPNLGAGGIFTIGGSGAAATGAMVAHLPSAGKPLLGLEIAL